VVYQRLDPMTKSLCKHGGWKGFGEGITMASGVGGDAGGPPVPPTPGLNGGLGPLTPERPEQQGGAPRKRRSRWAIVGLLVTLVVAAVVVVPRIGDGDGEPEHAAWDPRVQDIVRFVETERGLTFEHPVPVDFLTPEQFRDELTTEAADITPKDRRELRASEAIMRALGLLDGDIDLLDEFNTISTEGVAAFYDPARKQVFVPNGPLTPSLRATLAHELTHALQDQHYDLSAMQDDAPDDQASAQRALIEGDAQRIEHAYVGSLSNADMAQYREESKRAATESRRALEGVPPIIRAIFESPYVLGESLIGALLLDGGPSRINQAFIEPPTSEEHLLDPFTYLEGDDPIEVPTPALARGETEVDAGDLGAITWYLLLAERLDLHTALRAVDGWGGDAYVIYRSQDRFCLRAAFQGDDLAETAQMERALTAWVDTMPQASAALTREGEILTLRSCDPGPDVPSATRDIAERALLIPLVRTSLAGGIEEEGVERPVARCLAAVIIDRLPTQSLLRLRTLMTREAIAAQIRELASAAFESCLSGAG
jgi:hypothetical protein